MDSPFPPARVTIRDIAQALGLSRAAISLGLRNSPQISKTTCQRIQETAARMGYQPNLTAANLAHFRHHSTNRTVHAAIAWVNCWKKPAGLRSYQQFELYWQSARETAEAAGYRLEEFVVDSSTNLHRLQSIFVARNIHGIIIPPQHRTGYWTRLCKEEFDWNRFSAVRIGHSVRHPSVAVIAPDQVGNSLLAVEKMTKLGYNRIGYLALRDIRKSTQNWFLGGYYLAQIAQPSSQHVPVLYLEETEIPNSLNRIKAWITRHRPDAILTEWPEIPQMLETIGISVPNDMGLAVLNTLDCNIAAGIYQNPEQIGKAAAEVLIALINRNERGESDNYRTTTVMGSWQDGPTLPPKPRDGQPLPGRSAKGKTGKLKA